MAQTLEFFAFKTGVKSLEFGPDIIGIDIWYLPHWPLPLPPFGEITPEVNLKGSQNAYNSTISS